MLRRCKHTLNLVSTFVCISSLLGSFSVFSHPPTLGGHTPSWLARPPTHPPLAVRGSCICSCVPALLESVLSFFGRVQHYHRFACRQSKVLSGRLFSPRGPCVVSVSHCEQGLSPHCVRATMALLEGWMQLLSPVMPVFGDTVLLPS